MTTEFLWNSRRMANILTRKLDEEFLWNSKSMTNVPIRKSDDHGINMQLQEKCDQYSYQIIRWPRNSHALLMIDQKIRWLQILPSRIKGTIRPCQGSRLCQGFEAMSGVRGHVRVRDHVRKVENHVREVFWPDRPCQGSRPCQRGRDHVRKYPGL